MKEVCVLFKHLFKKMDISKKEVFESVKRVPHLFLVVIQKYKI